MDAISMGRALAADARIDAADVYRVASATKRMNRHIRKLKALKYRFAILHDVSDPSLFTGDRSANVRTAAASLAEALAAVIEDAPA